MRLDFYTIGRVMIERSGLMNSMALERFILRKSSGYPSDIYYVEIHPREIGYISLLPKLSTPLIGPKATIGMYDGIFDFLKIPFNQHYMHRTVRSMLSGKDIQETEYYRKLLKSMNKVEAAERAGKLDRLIKIFRETGYKSQYEMGNIQSIRSIGKFRVPAHEMIVGMDRYGRLFRMVGGRHRLAIAQNMGLEKMSAVLSLIHHNAINKMPKKSRPIRDYPEDFRPFES